KLPEAIERRTVKVSAGIPFIRKLRPFRDGVFLCPGIRSELGELRGQAVLLDLFLGADAAVECRSHFTPPASLAFPPVSLAFPPASRSSSSAVCQRRPSGSGYSIRTTEGRPFLDPTADASSFGAASSDTRRRWRSRSEEHTSEL